MALYKSITRTGLHLVFEGRAANAKDFKKAWYIYKEYLESEFKYLKVTLIIVVATLTGQHISVQMISYS